MDNLLVLSNETLVMACDNDDYQSVLDLINLSADLNCNDGQPLNKACENNNMKIVSLLLENGAIPNNDALDAACLNNNCEMVEKLLEYGCIPKGDNALTNACIVNNLEIAFLLMGFGAKPNIDTLCICIEEDNLDILTLLIEHGLDIQESNSFALQYALKFKRFKIIQYLVDNGADLLVALDQILE
jgi:ankyrin repeat protein